MPGRNAEYVYEVRFYIMNRTKYGVCSFIYSVSSQLQCGANNANRYRGANTDDISECDLFNEIKLVQLLKDSMKNNMN